NDGGFLIRGLNTRLTITNNTFQTLTADNSKGNWPLGSAIFSSGGDGTSDNSKISGNTFKNILVNGSATPDGTSASVDKSVNVGIFMYGLTSTSIDHNTFDHVGEGMHICFSNPYKSSGVYIGYNTFTAIHRMGIEIQGSQGCGGKAMPGPDTVGLTIEYN